MVLVDKTKNQNKLLFTISENQTDELSTLNLVLQSPFSNESFTIVLPENTSQHKSRYDEFFVNTSIFNNMNEGQYYYQVIQLSGNKLLESGLLELKGTPSLEYISVHNEESDDDLLVYQS